VPNITYSTAKRGYSESISLKREYTMSKGNTPEVTVPSATINEDVKKLDLDRLPPDVRYAIFDLMADSLMAKGGDEEGCGGVVIGKDGVMDKAAIAVLYEAALNPTGKHDLADVVLTHMLTDGPEHQRPPEVRPSTVTGPLLPIVDLGL
jgi:hypothetical protein